MILYIKDKYPLNKQVLDKIIELLPDGKYLIEPKAINNRSLNQNDYFHSIVLDLVLAGLRDLGFNEVKDKDDAKTVVKGLFLSEKIERGGVKITTVKKTSKLTKEEFSEFIFNIQIWASDYLNISIPDPNQQMEFGI